MIFDHAICRKIAYNASIVYPALCFVSCGISNMPFRVGMGFDVHRFAKKQEEGRCVRLCGIKIDHTHRIVAHSDGDVALHALTDALLGCIGAGSIGVHFSNADSRWENMDSSHFLLEAHSMVKEQSYVVSNFDITIICEVPKVAPFVPFMKTHMSELLRLETSRINIKAVTTEKLGFLGRGEGIAAHAVALCYKAQ